MLVLVLELYLSATLKYRSIHMKMYSNYHVSVSVRRN